jgi:DNA-binding transcriptional MerR regulator
MSMRIGELAAEAGVTTKTVRYYESIGLLAPPERTGAGYRAYEADAIDRLVFIRDAQASGLSLAEIQSILELKDAGRSTCEHTKALLARHLDELDAQIDRLKQTRVELSELAVVAAGLDPADCNDPHRCQVIEAGMEISPRPHRAHDA